jgi:sugar phosphate isomerase/epimerase
MEQARGLARRSALRIFGGAAVAAAGTVGLSETAAAESEADCRRRIPPSGIGMHLFTVRNMLAADPQGTLNAMADIGYACVGVSAFPRPAAEIRDMCRAARLRPVILHVAHNDILNNWPAKLEEARTIGVRWLVLASFPTSMYTIEGMRLGAQQLNEAGAAARRLGMGMLLHNHNSEFRVIDGQRLFEILLAETDPKLVDFELDIGWADSAGADCRKLFADNPRRFPVLHVKDHDGAGNWTDVGSGTVNWPRIFDKADRGGVKFWLVERDDQPAPLDTARNSFNYLRSLRF